MWISRVESTVHDLFTDSDMAHEQATTFEQDIRLGIPEVREVNIRADQTQGAKLEGQRGEAIKREDTAPLPS
jgi:cell division protein FtsX